ncbi:MAG TPA: ImmA/IrrE family metallo-endopeptidase [Pirellulales bacterium]|jgi:hypothetical protein|nr:ImmA/IrrE family metallo-endopeptidase [Pirellulales bacterium]
MLNGSRDQRYFDVRFYNRLLDSAAEQRSKSKATQAEAMRLVRRELIAAGTDAPPTDLKRLAKHLGVQRVAIVPLAMRGRLMLSGSDVEIEINGDLDEWSRRHTIAHELVHLVLEKDRVAMARAAGSNVKKRIAHGLIEQLCDLGADEILLPREWLAEKLKRSRPSMDLVVHISNHLDLPVDFVATRIVNLGLQPWRTIWCGRSKRKSYLVKSAPAWDELFLAGLDILDADESPVTKCWDHNEVEKGTVVIRIHGELHDFPSHCLKIAHDSVFGILYTGSR